MAFTNPIWLWALTGLLIPVGIHLLSRKEGRVIPLGSVRYIEDSATTQFKKVKLNEVLLLLVRSLLILWIVFLLSGLHFVTETSHSEKWLLIEQGLEKDTDFVVLIDSLEKEDFEVRYLSQDFPPVANGGEVTAVDSYWSLVEELQRKPLQQVIVLSYNYSARFKGKRIALPDNIHWIAKTPSATEFLLASITYSSGDSVWSRYGISNSATTKFTTVSTPGNTAASTLPDTLDIAVVSDTEFEYDSRIILAVLNTLQANTPFVIAVRSFTSENLDLTQGTDWIFWLSNQMPPKTKASLVTIVNTDQMGKNRLVEIINNGHWQITSRLNEGVALRNNLTIQLAELLLPRKAMEDVVSQQDRRVLPDSMAWKTTAMQAGISPVTTSVHDSGVYWFILILITLVVERLVASTRNQ